MRKRLGFAALLVGAACGGGSANDAIKIDKVEPSFGPLSGGTRIVITGQGFLRDGAPPNRVVIGDTEAPQAGAASDTELEVEVPPGAMPGDAPIVVFNQNGSASATGVFHYSALPTISSITPTNVLFSTTNTTVTVTGTGFKDENAGVVEVTLDGEEVVDLNVQSDTQLTFTALAGSPLVKPEVKLTNSRGSATKLGFRYIPGNNPGLIVFTNKTRTTMAVYYDPMTNTEVVFPQPGSTSTHVHNTFLDANNDYWGIVGPRPGAGTAQQFGKLDFHAAGTVDEDSVGVGTTRLAAMAQVNGTIVGFDRQTGNFGKLDPTSGQFTKIATLTNTCCHSMTVHNNQVYYTFGTNQLTTIDPTTGALGTIVTLSPTFRFAEMRFIGNTLYVVDTAGNLYTINPATGTVSTAIHSLNLTVAAMEVFNP